MRCRCARYLFFLKSVLLHELLLREAFKNAVMFIFRIYFVNLGYGVNGRLLATEKYFPKKNHVHFSIILLC